MAIKLTDTQTHRPALDVAGQIFEITKAVTFEAAHYLEGKPEGHPYRNVHGHSFRLEVTVAGQVQPGDEWVEDFSSVSNILKACAAKLDHKLLNEIEGLNIPTLERIAVWVAADLKPALPGLSRVELSRPSLDETCVLVVS